MQKIMQAIDRKKPYIFSLNKTQKALNSHEIEKNTLICNNINVINKEGSQALRASTLARLTFKGNDTASVQEKLQKIIDEDKKRGEKRIFLDVKPGTTFKIARAISDQSKKHT